MNKSISLQIVYMKKLGIDKAKYDSLLNQYTGNELLLKLVECEEKYSVVGKPSEDEVRFNNYKGPLDISCDYFDWIDLKCRFENESCEQCNLYFDLMKII